MRGEDHVGVVVFGAFDLGRDFEGAGLDEHDGVWPDAADGVLVAAVVVHEVVVDVELLVDFFAGCRVVGEVEGFLQFVCAGVPDAVLCPDVFT